MRLALSTAVFLAAGVAVLSTGSALWVVSALLVLTVAAAAIWGGRRPALLLGALIGGFTLFLSLTPLSAGRPWLAVAIFLGVAALFRAVSFFELRSRRASEARGTAGL